MVKYGFSELLQEEFKVIPGFILFRKDGEVIKYTDQELTLIKDLGNEDKKLLHFAKRMIKGTVVR